MKKVLVLLLVSLLVVSVSVYAAETPKAKAYRGYLSDVLCGKAGKDPAGDDLTKSPKKHTVQCMLAPDCAESGYGVFIRDAESKKYVFYAFDPKGSELAKIEILDKTQKADDMYISVKGILDKEKGILTVTSIKEIVKKAVKKEEKKEEKEEEPKEK